MDTNQTRECLFVEGPDADDGVCFSEASLESAVYVMETTHHVQMSGVPNGDNSTCADECGIPNGGNYCADDIIDSPFVGEWTVNLGNVYDGDCVIYEGYYYDYNYYNGSQGVFTINGNGTFTHSYCDYDYSTSQVGSWTSDGNTIDITLVCGDEYNGPI